MPWGEGVELYYYGKAGVKVHQFWGKLPPWINPWCGY